MQSPQQANNENPMQRQTVIVSGLLAYRMQRAAAARANAIGVEVLMLPQLAARLCGGFVEMAPPEVLFPLIRSALAEGGLSKFNNIAALPGMPRAVMETLRKIWNAGLDLPSLEGRGEQMADLERIEAHIRRQLPAAWLLPTDLRDLAVARAGNPSPKVKADYASQLKNTCQLPGR